MFPVDVKQGATPPSCFNSDTVIKYSFHGLDSAAFFACLCFLLVISQFKMAPKCNKAVTCLLKSIYVLEEVL